jgi:hypothetical protein
MTHISDGFPPETGMPEPMKAWLVTLDLTWSGREVVVNTIADVVREWLAGKTPSPEELRDKLAALESELQACARWRASIQHALLTGDLDCLTETP